MDDYNEKSKEQELIRNNLKTILLHLAARSDNPSRELHYLMQDVIDELYDEVKTAMEKKRHLKLV